VSLDVVVHILFVRDLARSISDHEIIVLQNVIVLLRSWLTVSK
jgi:hypothetical protein